MLNIKIVNAEIKNIAIASSFFQRLIGLMGQSSMKDKGGLLIKKCNSIHTFFMKFPIDVIFMNEDFIIKKVIYNLKPWRMTGIYFGATQVLECQMGLLPQDITPGIKVEALDV